MRVKHSGRESRLNHRNFLMALVSNSGKIHQKMLAGGRKIRSGSSSRNTRIEYRLSQSAGSPQVGRRALEGARNAGGLMSAPQSSPQQTGTAAVQARTNRRLHTRLAINREVWLCWQDRNGNHLLRARAMDVSKFGMLVEAEGPIAPGALVSVEVKSTTLGRGCVRHCTPCGIAYRIGLHMPDRMTSLMDFPPEGPKG
jgi:hypothetical protein